MASDNKNSVATGFDKVTGKIRRFVLDTIAEMGRCTWPSKQQLWESTILVVISMVILAGFVAGVDKIAEWTISLITVGKL